jgi:hypothetical protein
VGVILHGLRRQKLAENIFVSKALKNGRIYVPTALQLLSALQQFNDHAAGFTWHKAITQEWSVLVASCKAPKHCHQAKGRFGLADTIVGIVVVR